MRLASVVFLVLFAITGAARVASAQDEPKIGVTMGYPSAIGVQWQIADRIAVRPEITLTRSTGDSTSNDLLGTAPLSTNDSTGVGVGLSALFYVARWESLRTYVSPRFAYSRTTTSATTTPGSSTSDSTSSAYVTSGSFGAQYSLGRHFGVFGEIGLGYTAVTTALTSTLTLGVAASAGGVVTSSTQVALVHSSSHSNSLATRSGAGVIFFF
jgi:hypothetical protein